MWKARSQQGRLFNDSNHNRQTHEINESNFSGDDVKTLTLVTTGLGRPEPEEMRRLEAEDRHPRASLFGDELNSDILDERFLSKKPDVAGIAGSVVPRSALQVITAFRMRKQYDAVISWAEHLGLPYALLQTVFRSDKPHIVIWSWISKAKKAVLLKMVQSGIDRIILMSSRQRDFAVDVLKIPSSKVVLLRWPVDQKFWRPLEVEQNMICSVGREMRDFGTLVKALQGTGIRCHIAASIHRGKKDRWIGDLERLQPLPESITVGKKPYLELRQLYATSRFVVIPLYPTDTDNGTTSILESMAMGKAVICSRVAGQADVIQDGVNGIFVPPEDPKALREAVLYLWNNRAVAERMGKAGREFIEQNHTLDAFVSNVKRTVEEAIRGRRGNNAVRRHGDADSSVN